MTDDLTAFRKRRQRKEDLKKARTLVSEISFSQEDRQKIFRLLDGIFSDISQSSGSLGV